MVNYRECSRVALGRQAAKTAGQRTMGRNRQLPHWTYQGCSLRWRQDEVFGRGDRAQFCYIDAYTEPCVADDWPPKGWHETREQHVERLRNTPIHLCRLRYFGDEERWAFAFFAYSSEKYELSILPCGDFYGSPEDAFATAAGLYLGQE